MSLRFATGVKTRVRALVVWVRCVELCTFSVLKSRLNDRDLSPQPKGERDVKTVTVIIISRLFTSVI